ncbi:family 43 glycosylhydrolase [Dinghuibacter silviterrae]|uniref:Glycosyl hydrolase family 43 n=1 Tax=Dinghuibacter silviterrae TaxID=1539049 RepID=A0A4R8DEG5_9BACT|nr:family 43 glycosylhydrolase [Dinghuibacter silviterrae]TDW95825.1 glycosyl hydrolase family 43 [Dinghuibacter silviterrae]
MRVCLLLVFLFSAFVPFAQIAPGALWPDASGNHIQAHGGGILKRGDVYYWYGEERRQGLDTAKRFVSCYSSRDLMHWTFLGDVLSLSDPEQLGPHWILERPKVYYNAPTRRYVMYFHLDDGRYQFARVGVAVSAQAEGPFTYVRSFRPLGHESRDIGQFVDDDGTAYLIFEDRPFGFRIARLNPSDYLSLDKEMCLIKEHMEGGAIVHYKGLYYVIGSALTGWRPNPNQYATAASLEGPWSSFRDIAPPEVNTYGSQSTMLLKVDSTVIFMGDIWKPSTQWLSTYLWMPVAFYRDGLSLRPPEPWSIDVHTGTWRFDSLNAADVFSAALNPRVKRMNISLDSSSAELPVRPGTDLTHFDPEFDRTGGVMVLPHGAVDFSHGPVTYRVGLSAASLQTYTVSVVPRVNPILDGFYADPEILYARHTHKYYIYPTSDGYDRWSGTYFKTFSSTDLVHWKEEGVVLDLPKNVSWGKVNAWAPSIIEKNNRYYLYFCAAQKIGVAVSDSPAGPFVDSGKPLIAVNPPGTHGGQTIDPDVFADPVSGKDYLYWGNGYMAVAALQADMVSIDTASIRVITPDTTFREGTEVAYRKGRYYFFWSQDDTRSPNYCVRYGYAASPTGPVTIPADNLVLAKDPALGIYGTGHNAVFQVPGTDRWYIIYHRFTRPAGIRMGSPAGYHREVCIDRLSFNTDGTIQRVKPSL